MRSFHPSLASLFPASLASLRGPALQLAAACALGASAFVAPASSQMIMVSDRPELASDAGTLSAWYGGGDVLLVGPWAGLVGETGLKAGFTYNEHAVDGGGQPLAGKQAGNEILLDTKDLWKGAGNPVDILCSTIVKPGKVLVLFDTGFIAEISGLWGLKGGQYPSKVITYDLGLEGVGEATCFAEGLRPFADGLDAAEPLLAIGTSTGHFGFAGFDNPLIAFENPIISFDNPLIAFQEPLVGFSLKDKGFENPIISFDVPLAGHPILDVGFVADSFSFKFAALEQDGVHGIHPGEAGNELPAVAAAPAWFIDPGELEQKPASLGGKQLGLGWPLFMPPLPGSSPLLVSYDGIDGESLVSAVKLPGGPGVHELSVAFSFVMPGDHVTLTNDGLFGVDSKGALVSIPGWNVGTGAIPDLDWLVKKGGTQSFKIPEKVVLDEGLAPQLELVLEGLGDDLIDGIKGVDVSSFKLNIVGGPVPLFPTQVLVDDQDGDGHTELIGVFETFPVVRTLAAIGLGEETVVKLGWEQLDGSKGFTSQVIVAQFPE
jgi:hypothetical protein